MLNWLTLCFRHTILSICLFIFFIIYFLFILLFILNYAKLIKCVFQTQDFENLFI